MCCWLLFLNAMNFLSCIYSSENLLYCMKSNWFYKFMSFYLSKELKKILCFWKSFLILFIKFSLLLWCTYFWSNSTTLGLSVDILCKPGIFLIPVARSVTKSMRSIGDGVENMSHSWNVPLCPRGSAITTFWNGGHGARGWIRVDVCDISWRCCIPCASHRVRAWGARKGTKAIEPEGSTRLWTTAAFQQWRD